MFDHLPPCGKCETTNPVFYAPPFVNPESTTVVSFPYCVGAISWMAPEVFEGIRYAYIIVVLLKQPDSEVCPSWYEHH